MLDYPTLRAGEFYRSERKSANIRNINSRDKQAADFCCVRPRAARDMRMRGTARIAAGPPGTDPVPFVAGMSHEGH